MSQFKTLLGTPAGRIDLGLPDDWNRVESWLFFNGPLITPVDVEIRQKPSKWPNIPVLLDYSKPADSSFWLNFPKKDLPSTAETKIDVQRLEELIEASKQQMTIHQYERSRKALDYLTHGAPSFQAYDLPACFVRNSNSAFTKGQEVTEAIATWVAEGFAAGPFDGPPCVNFRVNPLIAVVQPGKVRPVLNVSSPEGASFNSAVDGFETETVKMATAKIFSQLLVDCGLNATMSKHDLVAAYKQVPCRVRDLRLQGFFWLGKYFVETRQVFGAKTSVCNYDILGETLKLLALLRSSIPRGFVIRQVDDVPSVAPQGSGLCENFSTCYAELCGELNVELAPPCPRNDKAFVNQVRGKVLGVMFDSTDLTWRLSDEKITKCTNCLNKAILSDVSTLRDCQKLLGRLNDIGQMCPFMKVFKHQINQITEGIPPDAHEDTKVSISCGAKKDLMVWAGFLHSQHKWLPVPRNIYGPPIWTKEFVSDAAGLPDSASLSSSPGCGNVGFSENGEIIFAHQFTWPASFISSKEDEKGVKYGDKTTTLEMIGLIMPLILKPELFIKSHVMMKVDCLGTVFGMSNKAAKGDTSASIFIRAAHLIAAYLDCVIHVDHLPRMTDWGAEVSDRLSRKSSSTLQDKKLVKAFKNRPIPPCLMAWFLEPKPDWSLATKLLAHVKTLV